MLELTNYETDYRSSSVSGGFCFAHLKSHAFAVVVFGLGSPPEESTDILS